MMYSKKHMFVLASLMTASMSFVACDKGEAVESPSADAAPTTASTESDEAAEKARLAAEAAEKKAMLEALPPLPGIEKPRPVEFPDPAIVKLDNGLEIIMLEDHESPLIRTSLEFKAGDIYAPADKPTLASLTASLLSEDSKKRKKAAIDEQVDATGGSMGASSSEELSRVSASMQAKDLDLAFKLMAERALTPAFPEDAIDKLKSEAKQGTKATKGQPAALLGILANKVTYGENSPYGRGLPTDEQIDGVTRDDVVAFHAKHYVPNNAMLVVAGDIDPKKVEKSARKYFGKWKAGDDITVPQSDVAAPDKPVVHIVGRRASAQATIAVLWPAPKVGEEGWLETELVVKLLSGGTLSTRLNQVLREQLGLTYGAYARYSYGYDGGMFWASGGTKRKTADQFTKAMVDLIVELRTAPVPDKDLERIKAYVSGRYALEAEGVGVAASRTVSSRMYDLPDDFWARYRSDVANIEASSLHAYAQQLLDPQRMQIIAIGKTEDLKEQLGGFGEIRVYDQDLKRIE